MAFVSLVLDCRGRLLQRHTLDAALSIARSANIPGDFDHSELETVRIILCLNLKCCQSRLRNLEVPMLLHADADVCHFENANLEQTATYFGKAVFLEISHAVPS